MKKEELYNAVLRAMGNQVPNDYRFCSNCIAHLVKVELNNISFFELSLSLKLVEIQLS